MDPYKKFQKYAQRKDSGIKHNNVKEWLNTNVIGKSQVKGNSSIVANGLYHEYQIDSL